MVFRFLIQCIGGIDMNSFTITTPNLEKIDCNEKYKPILKEVLERCFRSSWYYPIEMEMDESGKNNEFYSEIKFSFKGVDLKVLLVLTPEKDDFKMDTLRMNIPASNDEAAMKLEIIKDAFSCVYCKTDEEDSEGKVSLAGEFVNVSEGLTKIFDLFEIVKGAQKIASRKYYHYKEFLKVALKILKIPNLTELFRDFSMSDDMFRMCEGEIREAKIATKDYTLALDYWNNVSYTTCKFKYEICSENQTCSVDYQNFAGGINHMKVMLDEADDKMMDFLQEIARFNMD